MPRKSAPTVGLAMIVKDGCARELRRCLKSIAPYIDQVVVVGTGPKNNSAHVALEFGGQAEFSPWCDDFAKARNYSFGFLHTDWYVWADHDDVIQGAEQIKPLLAALPDRIGGVWCGYDYARDEFGNTTTFHLRERILRASIGWQWVGRLHESPKAQRSLDWHRCDDVVWVHQSGHLDQSPRNLPILLKWAGEEPENVRVWLFLGNQYFAHKEPKEAARWLTRFWMDRRGSPIDRHHAMVYAANCWREMGNVREAIRANMAGITEFPETADSYLGMCENMMLLKDWKKAILWGEQVLKHEPVQAIGLVNPLDYRWRVWNDLSVCYAADAQIEKAIDAVDLALSARPDPANQDNRALFVQRLEKEKVLDGYVGMAGNGNALLALKALPHELRSEKKARDVWAPVLLAKSYRGTQPRIAFFCGPSLETWGPETPETKGIGGSETAVVEVARRLAKEGWKPLVFNDCGEQEGEHDGVLYFNWERFRAEHPVDCFVSWRQPPVFQEKPNAPLRYLWCHDLHYRDKLTLEVVAQATKVLAVSEWHSQHLQRLYPFLTPENVDYVPNGIDLSRFAVGAIRKSHARFVYASSPDRGLAHLLRFWPYIRQVEGNAELHVFYGWESFLETAKLGIPGMYQFQDALQQMGQQPGIVWRGRVGQRELAREFMEADIFAYPTSFLETGFITGMEALAADLKIVTSRCGNIPYVVGGAGICIPGNAGSIAYGRMFTGSVYGMMHDGETRMLYRGKGPARAAQFTWDKAIEKWKALLAPKTVEVA